MVIGWIFAKLVADVGILRPRHLQLRAVQGPAGSASRFASEEVDHGSRSRSRSSVSYRHGDIGTISATS